MNDVPLILTLKLDANTFEMFDRLRRKHFPPERNFISAHLTLFHHLPGGERDSVVSEIAARSAKTPKLPLFFPRWRFLGKGAAVEVESDELLELRRGLAEIWDPHLTPQDRQKFRPHITIQNKTEAETARSLFETLSATHQPFQGSGVGLMLWRYLGGPWSLEREFTFHS